MPSNSQPTERVIPSPREERVWRGSGRGVTQKALSRLLRRNQTDEEKQLWRALKAGRFAGFKFRRQHQVGGHYLDFYCLPQSCPLNWTAFNTACRSKSSAMRNERSFWRPRVLQNFASGIISGTRTGKACCWKYGKRCIAARVASRSCAKFKITGSFHRILTRSFRRKETHSDSSPSRAPPLPSPLLHSEWRRGRTSKASPACSSSAVSPRWDTSRLL